MCENVSAIRSETAGTNRQTSDTQPVSPFANLCQLSHRRPRHLFRAELTDEIRGRFVSAA